MDLRKYDLTADEIQYFIDHTAGYQPFILDESRQVIGRGAWPAPTPQNKWFYDQKAKSNANQIRHWGPGHYMVLDRNNIDSTTWNLMTMHNESLRSMFDDFVTLAVQSTDNPDSVIEIGCNDGGLLLLALEKGCKEAIGYDFEPAHANIFNLLSKITDNKIKFVHEGYNSLTHTMNCQPADIVIANAVMCHLSDPLYFIKYLSTITNKTLLISCGVHKSNNGEMTINFHGKPKNYGSSEFPDVFTHHTTISYDLFVYALKECGFKEVYEIEHNNAYPVKEWYYGQHNMGFIAIR